jgi:hypothetical protein
MSDLDDLRRVLHDREALAPDPAGIAVAARAAGLRIRRMRFAGTLAGSVVAVGLVVALGAALLGRPDAARRLEPGSTLTATPTVTVRGGWPAVPSYTGPAVPGVVLVPEPTQDPNEPVSGRPIDPVLPFRVTLPDGWLLTRWWYEEGNFRSSYLRAGSTVDIAVITVLDPATRPASLMYPSGDPTTGQPGADGSLGWRADARHFVRVQLQGMPHPDLFRSIASTLDFTHQQPLPCPFSLGYLPPGMHLSGMALMPDRSTPNEGIYWGASLWFDYRTGPATAGHDLVIAFKGLDESDPIPSPPHRTTINIAGHVARYLTYGNIIDVEVDGVQGHSPSFMVNKSASKRITMAEIGRIATGMQFVPGPEDLANWRPLFR